MLIKFNYDLVKYIFAFNKFRFCFEFLHLHIVQISCKNLESIAIEI